MEYATFLDRVIEEGIEAAKVDYANSPEKLAGALAGFELCRHKVPSALKRHLEDARRMTAELYRGNAKAEAYWHSRCYESEIEWVCNVVSAMLYNQGVEPLVPPTVNGVMKAASIIGVARATV